MELGEDPPVAETVQIKSPQFQSHPQSSSLVTLSKNSPTSQVLPSAGSNIGIESIKEEPLGPEGPQVNSFIEVNADVKPEPYDAPDSTSTMIIPYHDFEECKTIGVPI